MSKFPGWRTMTSAERRNVKMHAMFEESWELKAKAAGWTHDDDANVYRNTDGRIDANKSWRELCLFWDIF